MTTPHHPSADDDQERVRPECRCPCCGEDEIDWLIWIDDERVRCGRCGTIYDPNQPDAEA